MKWIFLLLFPVFLFADIPAYKIWGETQYQPQIDSLKVEINKLKQLLGDSTYKSPDLRIYEYNAEIRLKIRILLQLF